MTSIRLATASTQMAAFRRDSHLSSSIACLLATSLLLLSGCSSLRWYSPTRDLQAQDLKTKLDKTDAPVTSTIATARANQKALLDKQLALEDETKASARTALIQMLADKMTFKDLQTHILDNRAPLVGGTFNDWDSFDQKLAIQKKTAATLARLTDEYGLLGYSVPSCTEISGTSAEAFVTKADNDIRDALKYTVAWQNKDYCAPTERAVAAAWLIEEGTIGATNKRLADAKKALDDLDAQSKSYRDCYVATAAVSGNSAAGTQACIKAWEKYKESGEPSANNFNAQTAERATQLKKLFDKLVTLTDTFSVKFVSETRAAAVDNYLSTITNAKPGEAPAKDTPEAAAKTILVENFLEALQKADSSYQKTTTLPLVMLQQYDKVQAEAAKRDLDSRKAEIALLNDKLQLQTEQLETLNSTLDTLKMLSPGKLKNPVYVLVTNCKRADQECAGVTALDAKERQKLIAALDKYLFAQTEVSYQAAKLDDNRVAAIHERAIAASEANLTQWKTLISTSSSVLSTYGATGVKPETLLSLINSLSLIAIGVGVN